MHKNEGKNISINYLFSLWHLFHQHLFHNLFKFYIGMYSYFHLICHFNYYLPLNFLLFFSPLQAAGASPIKSSSYVQESRGKSVCVHFLFYDCGLKFNFSPVALCVLHHWLIHWLNDWWFVLTGSVFHIEPIWASYVQSEWPVHN